LAQADDLGKLDTLAHARVLGGHDHVLTRNEHTFIIGAMNPSASVAPAPVASVAVSPRGKPNPQARALLLAAAERLIRRDGLEAVTIRAIAGEAHVATGLFYHHFAGKDELLVALLGDRLRAAGTRLAALPARAGTRTVRENLVEIVAESLDTLVAFAPLLAVLLSRPDLRPGVDEPAVGPDREEAIIPVRAYLEAELRAGRIRRESDLDAAATLLVGACHDLALHRALRRDGSPVDPALPQRLVDTLLAGLGPTSPRTGGTPS